MNSNDRIVANAGCAPGVFAGAPRPAAKIYHADTPIEMPSGDPSAPMTFSFAREPEPDGLVPELGTDVGPLFDIPATTGVMLTLLDYGATAPAVPTPAPTGNMMFPWGDHIAGT